MAEKQFAKEEDVERFVITAPKVVQDWVTGERSRRFYQIGTARVQRDGSITGIINSIPVGQWDGMFKLEPIEGNNNGPPGG